MVSKTHSCCSAFHSSVVKVREEGAVFRSFVVVAVVSHTSRDLSRGFLINFFDLSEFHFPLAQNHCSCSTIESTKPQRLSDVIAVRGNVP